MTKLYFRYGAMNSGKTAHLLVAAHQYFEAGRCTVIVKPALDTRGGITNIHSRIPGLQKNANIIIQQHVLFTDEECQQMRIADCVFVDEVQFLTPNQIEQLANISHMVPVICYGLRTDFRGKLFPAIEILMALADKIEEVKNICQYCTSKATMNLKISGSLDSIIDIGANEKYIGLCRGCWMQARKQQCSSGNNNVVD